MLQTNARFVSGVLLLAALSSVAWAVKPSSGKFPIIQQTLYQPPAKGEDATVNHTPVSEALGKR